MRASSGWLSSGVFALALFACNEILDNRQGVLRREGPEADALPTQPAPSSGEIATSPSPDSDGAAPDSVDAATPRPPAADAGYCPRGAKRCGATCVSSGDPQHGCAARDCSPCAVEGAVPACVAGACAIFVCDMGRADCNGDPSDGCESDLSSPASCGACGVECLAGPHATSECSLGGCTLVCEPGSGDCNDDPVDGCETDLADDPDNCGQCGRRCLFGTCVGGGCAFF